MFKKFLEKKGISADQFKELEETKQAELQNEYLGTIESELSKKASESDVKAIKEDLKDYVSKSDFAKLDKDIEELSLKIAKVQPIKSENQLAKVEIKQKISKDAKLQNDYVGHAVVKADVLHNLAVISGGTFNADEANVDAALLTLTANSPLLSGRLSYSDNFLSEILSIAVPLLPGEALQAVVLGSLSGAPAVTGEANTKPTVANKLSVEKVEAKKVAHVFYTTTEFLNRMGMFNQFVVNNFGTLINNKLKNLLYTELVSKGAAFSDPGVTPSENPNNYDALLAIAAQMGSTGFNPTHVFMNDVDVTNLVGGKAIDGHYVVYNGNSIFLFEGGATFIVLNGRPVRLIKTATDTQAVGSVTMIDANELQFGVTPTLDYRTNPYGEYFKDNIVEHLMETAFAVLKPSNKANAIVTGTFAEIIEDITEIVS